MVRGLPRATGNQLHNTTDGKEGAAAGRKGKGDGSRAEGADMQSARLGDRREETGRRDGGGALSGISCLEAPLGKLHLCLLRTYCPITARMQVYCQHIISTYDNELVTEGRKWLSQNRKPQYPQCQTPIPIPMPPPPPFYTTPVRDHSPTPTSVSAEATPSKHPTAEVQRRKPSQQ